VTGRGFATIMVVFLLSVSVLLVLLPEDDLQCGAGVDFHVYVVLAVTSCIAACLLFRCYLYTRNHPDPTWL